MKKHNEFEWNEFEEEIKKKYYALLVTRAKKKENLRLILQPVYLGLFFIFIILITFIVTQTNYTFELNYIFATMSLIIGVCAFTVDDYFKKKRGGN